MQDWTRHNAVVLSDEWKHAERQNSGSLCDSRKELTRCPLFQHPSMELFFIWQFLSISRARAFYSAAPAPPNSD
ncbi:hypothetical protein Y1Q_0023580 [Alligator mississippiensis]|uniref:Uncharacterized protein n=1 Tax=Alligator mississippiensis TaxID=8496 RepID=A0A151MMJ4_ALLMI|nr:hypothetical protein Y1Q_0023580 [Alligator mississippiensis]